MRRTIAFLLALALLPGGALGQETPPPKEEEKPSPKGEVLSLEGALRYLSSAQGLVDAYFPVLNNSKVAQALHGLVVNKGVRVRLVVSTEALFRQDSYAYTFAALSLKYPVEVRVVSPTRGIDPRFVADRRYMVVGGGLEDLPEGGPILLFREGTEPSAELGRFERTWNVAPTCRPRPSFNPITKALKVECVLVR